MFLEMDKARGPVVCIPWKKDSRKSHHEDDNVREKAVDAIEEKPHKHRNLFGGVRTDKDHGKEDVQGKKVKGSSNKEMDNKTSKSKKIANA